MHWVIKILWVPFGLILGGLLGGGVGAGIAVAIGGEDPSYYFTPVQVGWFIGTFLGAVLDGAIAMVLLFEAGVGHFLPSPNEEEPPCFGKPPPSALLIAGGLPSSEELRGSNRPSPCERNEGEESRRIHL
jgi:hypothetical protein